MTFTTRRLLSITAIIAVFLGIFGPKLFSQKQFVVDLFYNFYVMISNPLIWLFNGETLNLSDAPTPGVILGFFVGLLITTIVHVILLALLIVLFSIIWMLGSGYSINTVMFRIKSFGHNKIYRRNK